MLEYEIKNADALKLRLSSISRDIDTELRLELNRLGIEIQTYIRQSMKDSPPDMSKRYKRQKKKGLYHNPSFPNNYPRIDSGNLVKNITYHTSYRGLEVGDLKKTPYAVYLEEGTSKMEPRPFIAPTWEHYKDIIQSRVDTLLDKVIKR